MKEIYLTQNKQVMVDDADYDFLNQWKWYFANNGYAMRSIYLGKINGKYKYKNIFMHHLIINPFKDLEVDHINRNRLDNRKENLRLVTSSQNKINCIKRKHNTSGYKGVSWEKRCKKWVAYLTFNKIRKHLGYFHNIQGAILARKWGERLYFGA